MRSRCATARPHAATINCDSPTRTAPTGAHGRPATIRAVASGRGDGPTRTRDDAAPARLRSDGALSALQEAGFQPGQVAVQVVQGKASSTAGADDGAGMRTIALAAGVILGAIVGAVLGRTFGDGTLALILGAVIGAVVGGAIARAIAGSGEVAP